MSGGLDGLRWSAIRQALHAELGSSARYGHCVRVARLADRLAQRHGIDARSARTAGMLHDIARLWHPDRLLAACRERALEIDPFACEHAIILHAPLGAALVHERLGITDEGLLSAIRKHTVGDIVMTPLDKVVFIADGLEPGRAFPGRAQLEKEAFRDLDAGLQAVYASTMEYLLRRGQTPSPALIAALEAERKTA